MNNPQELAKELNKVFPNEDLKVIADNACLAFVLMWCLGYDPDDINAIMYVQKMRRANVIKKNCAVLWYEAVPYIAERELESVEFVKISSLKGIRKRTPVLFAKPGNEDGVGHWVGVENQKIKFNPLKYSQNVAMGSPVEMRVLKLKGAKN